LKLFISYPSDQKDLAERLRLALEAEGHEVFTDRSELKEGEPYHEALREAVENADAMVFFITPRSVSAGSYALTELDIAQRRWRVPGGRVLPVIVAPTPIDTIPPYLRSVTLLQPRGDTVAETVAAVDRMRRGVPLRAMIGAAGIVLLAIGAGLYGYQHIQEQRAKEKARLELQAAELAAAVQLCDAGSHAVAWKQFIAVVAARPGDEAVRLAREDCGMRWLREMRVVGDKQTFSELVEQVQPVLAQGLGLSRGERRADLAAHLGWADFLRSRDGVAAPDPVPMFKAAIADDPGNVYAHAMWAHNLAWTTRELDASVLEHFAAAAKGTRDRPWLRNLQFSVAYNRGAHYGYALVVADQMRVAGETPDASQRDRLWRYLVDGSLTQPSVRDDVLNRLPPEGALATFEWLYPAEQTVADRQPLHRFTLALLRSRTGQRDVARAALESLHKEFVAEKQDSRLSRATAQLLAELRKPA
jgi:hypothetical protein